MFSSNFDLKHDDIFLYDNYVIVYFGSGYFDCKKY